MKPNFVKVVFVIDESGSMYMSSKETINGINEFLQDQNKNSEGECEVSFYKFNSKINKVFEHKNLKDVAYLTEEDYIPPFIEDLDSLSIDDLKKACAYFNITVGNKKRETLQSLLIPFLKNRE